MIVEGKEVSSVYDKKKNSFFQHSYYYRAFARLARKVKPGGFTRAQSYYARDDLARLLAEECYEFAHEFAAEKKQKLSLQYMKLAARLLGLSLRPKKLADLDEIKKALAKLKAEKDVAVV